MFSNCISLISLPDISKWNSKNPSDIKNLLSNCFSLSFLPDISKWEYYNVKDINETLDYRIINAFSYLDIVNDFQFVSSQEEYDKQLDNLELMVKPLIEKLERLYFH